MNLVLCEKRVRTDRELLQSTPVESRIRERLGDSEQQAPEDYRLSLDSSTLVHTQILRGYQAIFECSNCPYTVQLGSMPCALVFGFGFRRS